MSVTGLSSDPNRLCKNSFHWRNDSGELDVFEAARYFSGANENPGYNNAVMFSDNFIREDRRGARMSLDMPMMRNPMINSDNLARVQKQLKENSKKYKQPSSPGGRLASFLNSLFNQTTSKKKKKKSKSGSTTKDLEEESPGGRKRRSSISHFRITTSNSANDSKSSMYSSSSSGFITPPTYAKTPTKSSYKEIRSFTDHQKEVKNGTSAEKRSTDCAWLEDIEEFRFSNGNIFKNGSFRNSTTNWADEEEIRGFRKFSDVDDGADTDSSSDLFDLPNHELDFYSSGLPVYGTTHMERIRIGAPISSAATV